VLLTITTTHAPATDLGFLLFKHPGRVQSRVPAPRCAGGADLALRLFEPLGWETTAAPVPLDPRRST
jgi:hypothetical protein